ncbi:ribonuclease HIII [Streptococcus cameli]
MSTVVLKLSKTEMNQLMTRYQAHQLPNPNAYVLGFFKVDGTSITAYTSGKVVFQGDQAEKLAQTWGYVAEYPVTRISPSAEMIGTDEVGNGSYFGGLAVVASYVTPADHAFLKSLGVDDSKKMNDQKIRQIAPLLKEKIPHQALLLAPQKYNQVIEQGYNAISVKVALHNQAIFLLLQKGIKTQHIVIDAFTTANNYQKYVRQEANQVEQPITLEEKAEGKYLAVAVSSIIARSLFLENLEDLSDAIGFDLPSGAGPKSDTIASKILKVYGMDGLDKTAKLHFANTQKAQKLL